MGAARDYKDQEIDYSDLSDENQSARGRALDRWGNVDVIDGGQSNYNPAGLVAAENSSTSDQKNSENTILSKENSPWQNNVGGSHSTRSQKSTKKLGGMLQKRSSKIAALSILGIITAFIGFLGAMMPSLVSIHVAKIIDEKLNVAGSLLSDKADSMMNFKIKYGNIKGVNCVGGIICRMGSVSERNIANLKKAGIEIETDGTNIFGNRKKITKMTFTDSKGSTTDFLNKSTDIKKAINTNPELRSAIKKGYNGRFASFLDNSWKKLTRLLRFNKAPADNTGKSTSEIIDDTNQRTNSHAKEGSSKNKQVDGDGDETDDDKNNKDVDADESKGSENMKKFAKEVGEELEDQSASAKLAAGAGKFQNFSSNVLNKVNGVEAFCTAYNIVSFGFTAIKVVKSELLAQYSLLFMSYSNKIMAGHATDKEVEALGNSLYGFRGATASEKASSEETSRLDKAFAYLANTANDTESSKSATDSEGYRAIAYNDSVGTLSATAQTYSVGLSKGFLGIVQKFFGEWGWIVRKACKVVAVVETLAVAGLAIASCVGAVAAAPVGGLALGGVCMQAAGTALGGWKAALGVISGLAVNLFADNISDYLTATISSFIVGDVVNKNTLGEDYGNAISSGAGALMSKNAISGGAAVLTKDQAVAFYRQNEQIIAKNAEYERATLSPFDVTSRHTFLGSIVGSIVPYGRQLATIGGIVPAFASIASRSIASVLPSASAANEAGFRANMEVCADTSITGTNAATDIFCNVYTGIDTSVYNMEPDEVIQTLINSGDLTDDDSKESILDNVKSGSGLDKYIKSCSDRSVPIGSAEKDSDDIGAGCVSTSKTISLYALFLTYARINDGMDSEMQPDGGQAKSSANNPSLSGKGDFVWPIEKSKVTGQTEYGPSSVPLHNGWHTGLDIWADKGTPIYAVADGEVTMAGPSGGCGPAQIEIRHANNIYSVYCHNQSGSVKVGEKVKKGQQIGTVGDEGYAKGTVSHLHLEITEGQPNWSNWKTGRKSPKDYIGDL